MNPKTNWLLNIEMCMLSEDIHDYYYVSQGKTTIPGMDDGEEFQLTDVRTFKSVLFVNSFNPPYPYLPVMIWFVEMLENRSKRRHRRIVAFLFIMIFFLKIKSVQCKYILAVHYTTSTGVSVPYVYYDRILYYI